MFSLLIFDPSITKGQVSETLVSNIDVPPTIMHLFGLEPVKKPLQDTPCFLLRSIRLKVSVGEAKEKRGAHEKRMQKHYITIVKIISR